MHTPLPSGTVAVKVWLWSSLTGLTLGLAAVAADALPTGVGRLLIVVASTGLSWAIAAVVCGASSPTPTTGAVSGLAVLLAAVMTYYVTIGTFGLRPSSTPDLLATGTVWLVVGAAGGLTCGWLGWFARNGRAGSRPLAVGALAGILMSQGVFVAWSAAVLGEFPAHLLAFLTVTLGAPLIAVVVLCRRRGLARALSAMVAVAVLAGVAWSSVMARV